MKNKFIPMKMVPVFKDYLWGGNRLASEFNKNTPMRPLAESWEISCHPDGLSKISSGLFVGSSLDSVLKKHPEMVGKGFSGEFPILIKLIDAKQSLSLQVHPNNEYAITNENQLGKNEMWYVVDAIPEAELIIGFRGEYSRKEIEEKIKNNTILEIANAIPVKAGDCFEIPAGMLHAIGKGVVIAEIQQSSNVTYRVYDYNRKDSQGNSRELHVGKALDVIDTTLATTNSGENPLEQFDGYRKSKLTDWEWFNCCKIVLESHAEFTADEQSFHALLVLEGEITLICDEQLTLSKGDSVFVPAGAGKYVLKGNGQFLLTSIE